MHAERGGSRRRAALRARPDAPDRADSSSPASLDAPGVDEGRLREAVADRYGASPPAGRAPGHRAPSSRSSCRRAGTCTRAVTPRLDARARARSRRRSSSRSTPARGRSIGAIDVIGSAGDPESGSASIGSACRPGVPYEPDALNRANRGVPRRIGADAGYYEARVTIRPQLADDDRVAQRDARRSVPGPRVRVAFNGDPLPADQRDELVPIAREGSADEDLLEDSQQQHRGVPARAGLPRRHRPAHARGDRRRAAHHLHGQAGPAVPRRRASRSPATRRSRSQELAAAAAGASAGQPFAAAALDADLSRASRSSIAAAASPRRESKPPIEPAAGRAPTPRRSRSP